MTLIDNATVTPESTQLVLNLQPLVTPEGDGAHLSIEERFELFHVANPHVADNLEYLAAEWLAAGNSRLGVKALFERLRWETGIQTTGDPYRLNNDFTAPYARLLIGRHPAWGDAIETRESPRERRAA